MTKPKTMFQKVCAFYNETVDRALSLNEEQRGSDKVYETLQTFRIASELKEAVIEHGDIMAIIKVTKPFYENDPDNPMVKDSLDSLWTRYRTTLATIQSDMQMADEWLERNGHEPMFAEYAKSKTDIDRHCALTQAELNGEDFTRRHRGYLDMAI